MNQQNLSSPSLRRKRRDRSNDGNNMDEDEPMQISDLRNMDASKYLDFVNSQASKLPDVFTADSATNDQTCVASSPTSTTPADATTRHAHASSVYEAGEDYNVVKEYVSTPAFAAIDGSLAASQYLLSHRTVLRSPPSRHYLPKIILKQHTTISNTNISPVVETSHGREKWINLTLSNFSELRRYLIMCRAAGLGKTNELYKRVLVPKSKDRSGWHIFCLGRDEAMGNINGYFGEDDDDSNEIADELKSGDDNIFDEAESHENNDGHCDKAQRMETIEWDRTKARPFGFQPTTALLCQFDQILVRRVLSHHVYYLSEGWALTVSRGQWIYALLSRLEKPLHQDDASTLRKLLVELCRIRAEINFECDDEDKLSMKRRLLALHNVLITVIGVYYEQAGGLENVMTVVQDSVLKYGS